jgi:hypothetical protein
MLNLGATPDEHLMCSCIARMQKKRLRQRQKESSRDWRNKACRGGMWPRPQGAPRVKPPFGTSGNRPIRSLEEDFLFLTLALTRRSRLDRCSMTLIICALSGLEIIQGSGLAHFLSAKVASSSESSILVDGPGCVFDERDYGVDSAEWKVPHRMGMASICSLYFPGFLPCFCLIIEL